MLCSGNVVEDDAWCKLLNPVRFRPSASTISRHWNPFDSDYSRVAFSSPFRRLQDKAQVFPLDQSDFVRTRLTHSIEVSGIARSLGVGLENFLMEVGNIDSKRQGHIPSVLSVAGLAHDIGNPPFGHFGETSIQNYFKDVLSQESNGFSDLEKMDLCNFDGNVQSFRLLLKLGIANKPKSFNLTYPVLATIIKYPHDSLRGNRSVDDRDRANLGVSYKKFGYFQAEKDEYQGINEVLGLKDRRHPLCYLLEAADDICYSVSDIEDGVKKNTIDVDSIFAVLGRFSGDMHCDEVLVGLKKIADNKKRDKRINDIVMAQECRILVQQRMIHAVLDTFIQNHRKIIDGEFDCELIDKSKAKCLRAFCKKVSEENFSNKDVVKRELIGNRVVRFLVKEFYEAANSKNKSNEKTKEGKLFSLISRHYRSVEAESLYPNKKYTAALLVTDFVSSMTDSYALGLYNELRGVS